MYTVDYFIKKFEGIPEDKWHIGGYESDDKERKCALGWCNDWRDREINGERYCLETLLRKVTDVMVGDINDGGEDNTSIYQQSTPKQRILAAMYDIKKMQQPEYKDATRELIESINIGDTSDVKVKEVVNG